MGGGESYEVVSPWSSFDEDNQTFSEEETASIKAIILDLTKSANIFLNKNKDSKLSTDFLESEKIGARIEGAIQSDPRVAVWINKLVPKLVSEDEFWFNYFSHVSQAFIQFRQKDEQKPSTEPSWENVKMTEPITEAQVIADEKEAKAIIVENAEGSSEKPQEMELQQSNETPKETAEQESSEKVQETKVDQSIEKPLESSEKVQETKVEQSIEKPLETEVQQSCEILKEIEEQKSSEKSQQTEVEQSIEKLPETEVQQSSENIKETEEQHSSEKPQEMELEQSIEKPQETEVQQSSVIPKETEEQESSEKAQETVVEQSIEKPQETEVQQSSEISKETEEQEISEKSQETEVEQRIEKPQETEEQENSEKSPETEVEQSIEKPQETEVQLSSEIPKETEEHHSSDKPQEMEVEQSIEKPQETEEQEISEKSPETEVKQSIEKPQETEVQPSSEIPKKTEEHSSEKPQEIEVEQSIEKPQETEVQQSSVIPKETEEQRSSEKNQKTEVEQSIERPQETEVQQNSEIPRETEVLQSSEKPHETEKPEDTENPDTEEKLSTPNDIDADLKAISESAPEPDASLEKEEEAVVSAGEITESPVEIPQFPDFDKMDSFLFDDYPDPFKPSTEDMNNQPDLGGNVRWGIVGCGKVCEIKAGPAFQRAIGSELVAVMRRDAEKAEDFAKRHGVKKFYSNAHDLINDPDVTAVYIATPPGLHKEYAIMAARAGKPCLVEKPIARSYSEGQQIVEEFENRSVPLYVAYYRRGLPRFIRARQIVTKHLGNVTSITYNYMRQQHLPQSGWDMGWRIEPEHSGGGIFMDLGCHVLDILDFLFGPLDRVSGSAVKETDVHPKDLKVPTCIAAQFRTRTKALGTVMFNFASPKEMDRLTIVGTEGTLQMSVFGHEAPLFARPKLLPSGKISTIPRQVNCPVQDSNVHRSLVQNIVNELRRVSSAVVISSGKSALRTARIMDIILSDFYKGRSDDFWKRPETFGDS
jgi:1,5-anhydro-D-fructose reductase (1,5-anhydro-D-mannitol-forming)